MSPCAPRLLLQVSDIYQFYTQRHTMEPRVEGVEQMISSIFSRSGGHRVTSSSRSLGIPLLVICAVAAASVLPF